MYSELSEGHPIRTYLRETELIENLLDEIMRTDPSEDYQKFYNLFNQLSTVEKRFQRKENQLFPFLEQRGWTNPSQNMWSFHDTIRDMFRLVRKNLEEKDLVGAKNNMVYVEENLQRLLNIEYNILFARALDILSEDDWIKMRQGEEEIG